MSRAHLAVLPLLVTLLPLSACGEDTTTIQVLAASSLTETFTELADRFEAEHDGVEVELSFDSSTTLAQQALDGAPGDVLATADTVSMAGATDALASDTEIFATNEMVMVTPAGGTVGSFDQVATGDATYVACVESAPCGRIWQELAADNDVTNEPASLEVDVKSVLTKVTSDEADAGFVYRTDAQAAGDEVETYDVPGAADHVTSYPIATLQQAGDAGLAEEFVRLVLSDEGRQVLADAGFGPPDA